VFLEHTDQDTAGKILMFGFIPFTALAFLYLAWSGSCVMLLGIVLLVLQFREQWRDEAQEVNAQALAGAVCLLCVILLTALGVNDLTLLLLSTFLYQVTLALTTLSAHGRSGTLTNL
jgi:uncharacterized membrane protein YiaA